MRIVICGVLVGRNEIPTIADLEGDRSSGIFSKSFHRIFAFGIALWRMFHQRVTVGILCGYLDENRM